MLETVRSRYAAEFALRQWSERDVICGEVMMLEIQADRYIGVIALEVLSGARRPAVVSLTIYKSVAVVMAGGAVLHSNYEEVRRFYWECESWEAADIRRRLSNSLDVYYTVIGRRREVASTQSMLEF